MLFSLKSYLFIMLFSSIIISPLITMDQKYKTNEKKNKRNLSTSNVISNKKIMLEKGEITDIKNKLENRSILVAKNLKKINESLEEIQNSLTKKAREFIKTEFKYATEIATFVSNIMVLESESHSIINTLEHEKNSKEYILNTSLAIISSAALRSQIDTLINSLEKHEGIKEVNINLLKNSNGDLYNILNDNQLKLVGCSSTGSR